MPMIPPLVGDPPPGDAQSSTARPVAARLVRTQRQYASGFNVSYTYEPPKPITKPGFPTRDGTLDKWRTAAAEMNLPDGGAGEPAAGGDAVASGVAAPPRRTLHDALLGTTAVVLLGVLGGIGYAVWSGALPGVTAPGGTAAKGSGTAAWVQPLADAFAKAVARAGPGHSLAAPPGKEAADVPPSQPTAPLPSPSADPERLALATPSADKAAAAGPSLPVPGPSTMAAGVVLVPGQAAPAPVPLVKLPDPDAAPPMPTLPAATAGAGPAPEQAAAVPSASPPELVATPPAPAVPSAAAPVAEPAAPAEVAVTLPPKPDAALPAPAMAAATVRLLPAPDWTGAGVSKLDSLPEAAALLAAPPALPAVPTPSAGLVAPTAEMAKAAPAGVDAQQVVSTMELVQQMSLLVHDMHGEGVRYHMEVTALTGAVQAKAASLEERLKLAEARSVAGADAGGPQAAGVPPVLRGYRVQAGSPGAAVLSDVSAGPERAARLLVMVGDQLPGAGRVTGIVQRGGAWTVRTERGVIQ